MTLMPDIDYENIFLHAPVGMCVSQNRVIHACNEALAAMFAYSRTALTGQSFAVLYPTVDEFERTLASVPASPANLFRDGAWGSGTGVFQVAVTPSQTNLAVRIYVGDSFMNWSGISLTVEGNTGGVVFPDTNANPFFSYVLAGSDSNGDGVWNISISSGDVWVVNGIDVATGGVGNLP